MERFIQNSMKQERLKANQTENTQPIRENITNERSKSSSPKDVKKGNGPWIALIAAVVIAVIAIVLIIMMLGKKKPGSQNADGAAAMPSETASPESTKSDSEFVPKPEETLPESTEENQKSETEPDEAFVSAETTEAPATEKPTEVPTDYSKPEEKPMKMKDANGRVKTATGILRDQAEDSGDEVGVYDADSPLFAYRAVDHGAWHYVRMYDGKCGWMQGSSVETETVLTYSSKEDFVRAKKGTGYYLEIPREITVEDVLNDTESFAGISYHFRISAIVEALTEEETGPVVKMRMLGYGGRPEGTLVLVHNADRGWNPAVHIGEKFNVYGYMIGTYPETEQMEFLGMFANEISEVSEPQPEPDQEPEPDPDEEYWDEPDPEYEYEPEPDPDEEYWDEPDPEYAYEPEPDPDDEYTGEPDPESEYDPEPDPGDEYTGEPAPEFGYEPDPGDAYEPEPEPGPESDPEP